MAQGCVACTARRQAQLKPRLPPTRSYWMGLRTVNGNVYDRNSGVTIGYYNSSDMPWWVTSSQGWRAWLPGQALPARLWCHHGCWRGCGPAGLVLRWLCRLVAAWHQTLQSPS
jgi:hypothetical protein